MSAKKREAPTPTPTPSTSAKKHNPGRSSPLTWTPEGLHVFLPDHQAAYFVGRGTLAVSNGELAIWGKVINNSTGQVPLTTSSTSPLVLSVTSTDATVPLAGPGGARFTITDSTPVPRANQPLQSEESTNDDELHGFKVWLQGTEPPASLPGSCQPALPVPQAWEQVVGEVCASIAAADVHAPPPIIVVCGPKKVGKSTIGRYLMNCLLNIRPNVAYLDTDCGQPEFTPPGLVSLHLLHHPITGPPHTHMRPPQAAHFLGDVSPAVDPTLYLDSITSLYEWYCKHCSTLSNTPSGPCFPPPLIINTHGWVRGTGYDVLIDMLRALPVTHMLNITTMQKHKNLPSGMFWAVEGQVAGPLMWEVHGVQLGATHAHERASPVTTSKQPDSNQQKQQVKGVGGSLSAVDARQLQWLAFASECIGSMGPGSRGGGASGAGGRLGEASAGELGDALAGLVPYEVGLDDVDVQVVHTSIPTSQLPHALCGSIVGLCVSSNHPSGRAGGGPLLCKGLGLIRAVDAVSKGGTVLYLVTPLSEAALQDVDTLQLGRLELPPVLLQTSRFMFPYMSLFSMSASGTGAGAVKSRNNLLRAGQLN